MEISRYELNDTCWKINGYVGSGSPRVPMTDNAVFETAKKELQDSYRRLIDVAEDITLEQYNAAKSTGFRA